MKECNMEIEDEINQLLIENLKLDNEYLKLEIEYMKLKIKYKIRDYL